MWKRRGPLSVSSTLTDGRRFLFQFFPPYLSPTAVCLHGGSPHSWYNVISKHSNCVQHEGSAMHDHPLTPFVGQRYLNLESVKRDGTPVQTAVGFAEEQGVLYV